MELSNRTNVFAETSSPKQSINHQRRREICRNDPRRQPWAVPQTKSFVCPEINDKQSRWNPLRSKPSRPSQARGQHRPPNIANERERTRHAENIPDHQQSQNRQTTPMDPGQHSCHVQGRYLRSPKAVNHHASRDDQHRELRHSPQSRQSRTACAGRQSCRHPNGGTCPPHSRTGQQPHSNHKCGH